MALYACNVKDEKIKQQVKYYLNFLSEKLEKDRGELIIEMAKFYIEQKKIKI